MFTYIALAIPALILIYLVVVVFFPGFEFSEEEMSLQGRGKPPAQNLDFREDVQYQVEGETVRGWFYRSSNETAPCVIMATGLGGTRRMGLEGMALEYRRQGFHCLTIDFRNLGQSDGRPRNLVSPLRQLADLRGALRWANDRPEVSSIFIWGASAAGSYGLILAAEQGARKEASEKFLKPRVNREQVASESAEALAWPQIHGVICQVPSLDTVAEFRAMVHRIGFFRFLRLFMHAQRDRARGRLGLSPHYIPMVAPGKDFAFLQGPSANEGYTSLASGDFENRICARSLIMPPAPSAMRAATDVKCPVLIQLASRDALISSDGHLAVVRALDDLCEVKSYDGGHFDLYLPPLVQKVQADQGEFMRKCLASEPN
ncbi:MAG TPA: hypothetical protein DEA96_06770 [Leptospiraceae bacterium]|nr:hypothetical protein [Spirochaetaceae bacterium]HBS04647.1 hypothetical protein [Leptospiraceae bacterium]|tara:strand:+ start:34780 stop:35901 length:1122 start_codon:yes stop_codon:yes gene_type:complete